MKRICVYCGSRPGASAAYGAAARTLGQEMATRGIGLVYGGARVGLMGTLADAVLRYGGVVIGVIPRTLTERELAHDGLDQLVVTDSMHERKAVMAERSDAFIALPGGIGTLEEIFEIWTWSHLGLHSKPCGVLNVAGYYDRLVAFLDHAHAQGFIDYQQRARLLFAHDPGDLLDRLAV